MASKNNIFSYNSIEKKFTVNSYIIFDMYQNHGFPPELALEEINNKFKERPDLKAYHLSKAYDLEMGTNWSNKFIKLAKEHLWLN